MGTFQERSNQDQSGRIGRRSQLRLQQLKREDKMKQLHQATHPPRDVITLATPKLTNLAKLPNSPSV